jgi:hypothetical protein
MQTVAHLATTFVVGGMKVKAMTADSEALELALNYTQIVSWSLSLGTNFVATVLIAIKAWCVAYFCRIVPVLNIISRSFRQNISQNIGDAHGRGRVEKILALLIETGLMYCLTQVSRSLIYAVNKVPNVAS